MAVLYKISIELASGNNPVFYVFMDAVDSFDAAYQFLLEGGGGSSSHALLQCTLKDSILNSTLSSSLHNQNK